MNTRLFKRSALALAGAGAAVLLSASIGLSQAGRDHPRGGRPEAWRAALRGCGLRLFLRLLLKLER